MAKKSDGGKRSHSTNNGPKKQEGNSKSSTNLGKSKKRDTDDTGPRDKLK